MTKKELIEGGWIDKYILGLTSEDECHEVERLANIYPEVQAEINRSRIRLCGKFNRNLTQPALRLSFITKRRVLYGSGIMVLALFAGMAILYRQHSILKHDYSDQTEKLAKEEAMLSQFSMVSRNATETSNFLHAPWTKRIRLKGCATAPDAEVMVFQCRRTGRMMLRVIDLPELNRSQHYEVWAQGPDQQNELLGRITPPIRFDSLYTLDSALSFTSLQIMAMDSVTAHAEPICLATVSK
ncbi:MAG TPA: hypothetical protein VJ508_08160 [Saprospiraceae bacterium]|nr:hypothetical protein [Saprospiraceae bacterium]